MQDHKVMREKDICPKFCYEADLRFQKQYQAEQDVPSFSGRHGTGNSKKKLLRILI